MLEILSRSTKDIDALAFITMKKGLLASMDFPERWK